jgi:hypothetical protein
MSLIYDGRKLIPAPLVSLSKTYRTTDDGIKVGAGYEIVLRGSLLPFRGSPRGHYANISGAFWTDSGSPPDEVYAENNEDFSSILRKQEAMRWLFSRDGRSLEWQPAAGQPVVKCNPRVTSIAFAEGSWADKCDYTINLQAETVYLNGAISSEDNFSVKQIVSANEVWNFEDLPGQAGSGYRLNHSVTAKAIVGYDETGAKLGGKEAWQHAKDFCDARATGSVDSGIVAAVAGTGWIGGSYTRTVNIDKTGGGCTVAETWIIAPSTTYIEREFSVEYDSTTDEYRVRYQGTIRGIAGREGSQEAIIAAKAAIPSNSDARGETLKQIGSLLHGKTLGAGPDSRSIALNQRDGTVTFAFEWTSGDNANYAVEYDSNLAHDPDSDRYTLTLSCLIQGRGDTGTLRLTNARGAVPSDEAALTTASTIQGTQMPVGVIFSTAYRSRSVAVNEKQGRITLNWAWDNSPTNDLSVNVQINQPSNITAILAVPGRAAGPIIQDMNTKTEKTAQVSIRGKRYSVKPDAVAMRSMADAYLGVPVGGFYVQTDSESWNPVEKTYERTVRYLIKEGY